MRTALPAGSRPSSGRRSPRTRRPARPHPQTPPSPGVLKTAGPVAAAADKARGKVTGRGQD